MPFYFSEVKHLQDTNAIKVIGRIKWHRGLNDLLDLLPDKTNLGLLLRALLLRLFLFKVLLLLYHLCLW